MKKILLLLTLTLVLVGCSESQVEKVAEKFLNDSKTSSLTDSDYVTNVMALELNAKKDNFVNKVVKSLGIEESEVELEDLDEYELLAENIAYLKEQTLYEIKDVQLNDDKDRAVVKASIEYVDIGNLVIQDISSTLDRNILKIYSGENIDEAEFLSMTMESINFTLDDLEFSDLTVKTDAEVELVKKDKEWVISSVNDEALNAFTLNVLDMKNDVLDEKLEQAEENRLFLEIESNLRSIFEITSKLIKDEKVSMENLVDDGDVVNKALNRLNVESEVVDKAGSEDSIYYISKGNGKNELTITVTDDGNRYVFSENVK